jgi:hypothetical protein
MLTPACFTDAIIDINAIVHDRGATIFAVS